MKKNLSPLNLSAASLALLMISACGGDDDSGPNFGSPVTDSMTTAAPTTGMDTMMGTETDTGADMMEAGEMGEDTMPNTTANPETSGGETGEPTPQDPDLADPATPTEMFWYLSNGAGDNILIDFRKENIKVTCNDDVASSPTSQGTAVYTDPSSRELVLYGSGFVAENMGEGITEDGVSFFNGSTHQPLAIAEMKPDGATANDPFIMGQNNLAESLMFAPKPGGTDNEFYAFTTVITNDTNGTGTIYYHEIDMGMGDNGTVVSTNNSFATGQVGSGLDILPKTDASGGFWVLTFNAANRIQAYPVDADLVMADTIPGVVVSNTVSLTGSVRYGSITHSGDEQKVAIAVGPDGGANYGAVTVVDFDSATGMMSGGDSQTGNLESGVVGYQPCLNHDGTLLYFTRGESGFQGQYGRPYQAYLGGALPKQHKLSDRSGYGGCKMGPDGKIYWTGANLSALSVVESPDEREDDASFMEDVLDLGGCKAGFALPNQAGVIGEAMPEGG